MAEKSLPYELVIQCLINLNYDVLWNCSKATSPKETIFTEAIRIKLLMEKPSIKFRYRLTNLCPRGNCSSSYINKPFCSWEKGVHLKFDSQHQNLEIIPECHYSSLIKKEKSSFRITANNIQNEELIFNPLVGNTLKFEPNNQFNMTLMVESCNIASGEDIRLRINSINVTPELLFSNPELYDLQNNCFYL
ncbi:hypothetical protein K502DRAFT_345340 [Neoconidiobolus thromboides FSU 785]|nr:hypothetical protein K502DRAFT_345340 [Neoconidiobolus thromboides FSU 785]